MNFVFTQGLGEGFRKFGQFQASHHVLVKIAFIISPGREGTDGPAAAEDVLDFEFAFSFFVHGEVFVARFPIHQTAYKITAILHGHVLEFKIIPVTFSDEIVEKPEPCIQPVDVPGALPLRFES